MTRVNSKKVIALKPDRRRRRRPRSSSRIIGLAVVVAIGIGLFLGFRPNAYQVMIQGKSIGAIKEKKILDTAKETVAAQLESLYGTEVKFEEEVELKKYRAKKRDYIDPSYLITYMRKNMNVLIAFKEIIVDGKVIGIVASDDDLEVLKESLKKAYYGNKDVEVDFGKKVETKQVFAKEADLINHDLLVEKCTATTPKIVEYEVKSGDSLWLVADKLGVTTENIIKENPKFSESNVLRIGEMIKAKVNEPLLPLVVIEKDTQEEGAEDQNKEIEKEA
ncbi:LysM peptidoglycan-binding domain-containing protein [Cellulosilyticum sp. I15G10I2]|uniref:LysM peptidoglycan-binding domain-containing protein n=1 Tax=Cellulosilyticum sp. I15G10I2 TaxID=1892843 RepID=UPI00085BC7F4|nr:LysM domain-containing protein [Cellulosilyticum sp. I15G10I2]